MSLRRCGAGLKPRPVPDVLIDRPKSGLGVYQALSTRPRTLDELAERSQHSRATVYRRLDDLAELGLAARTKDGRWVRGQLGLAAAAWRTGGYQLHRARVRRYRRERQAWRARLDAWYRPAALIPAPRPPSDIPASPPPAAHAPRPADEADPHWHLAEPPDDDPWAGPSPETPAEPLDMVLQLLEEVLGAVPIDEHGWRPHRRSRPRPAKPAGTITRRGAPASRPD